MHRRKPSSRGRIRPPGTQTRRGGAVAVESAIVLSVFLVALFVMLDLALAAIRSNALSECARRASRAAIVLGDRTQPPRVAVGPAAWSGTAAETFPLCDAIRPLLIAMNPADVEVRAQWPDGGCRAGQRVQIELRYAHDPLVPFWTGGPWQLTASSTMRVMH